ncbi:MAG: DUF4097 family beta strand repeat protein [Clostridia bacterium]|nr:DUF4097 family beta strand repeat protein [Clostridia bacterium]
MKKSTVILLSSAIALIVIGALIAFGAMMILSPDFNFENAGDFKMNKRTVVIQEEFKRLKVSESFSDIELLRSQDNECKIEFTEPEKVTHTVSVDKNGLLSVKVVDERKWYDNIGIGFSESKVKIYLPEKQFESLDIDSASGDAMIAKEIEFINININTASGDITFDSDCKAGYSKSTGLSTASGDITVNGLYNGSLFVKTASGDIKLNNVCLGGDIEAEGLSNEGNSDTIALFVETASGSIKCNKLCGGKLSFQSASGDIELLNVCSRGRIEINTASGDIGGNGVVALDYIDVSTTSGDISIKRLDVLNNGIGLETTSGNVYAELLSEKTVIAKSTSGDIDIPDHVQSSCFCRVETTSGDIEIEMP